MIEIYALAHFKVLLLLLLFFCVFMLQAVYVSVLVLNYRLLKKQKLVCEILMLLYSAILAMVQITVLENKENITVQFINVSTVMYTVGIFVTLYFVYIAITTNDKPYAQITAVMLTMPFLSKVVHEYFVYLIIVSGAIMLVRIYYLLKTELYKQKNELTAFSVKEGLDTLPAGVMFCDNKGYIFFTNAKMNELVLKFTNSSQTNGKQFWQLLQEGNIINGECQFVEQDIVISSHEFAWQFSKDVFVENNVEYIEIIAIDVTKIIGTLRELEEERNVLIKQNEQTKILNEKLEVLSRELEYSRIRSQVHDVLSQNLTAMQRISQNENITDYSDLLLLSRDTIEQIKSKRKGDAQKLFGEMYFYFRKIGLFIELLDELPSDEEKAFLFLSVLREACTNAIKHAGATNVYVKIKQLGVRYRIEITNNGMRPKKGLVEGGGLFGIRNRIESANGTLRVELIPEFSLIITI